MEIHFQIVADLENKLAKTKEVSEYKETSKPEVENRKRLAGTNKGKTCGNSSKISIREPIYFSLALLFFIVASSCTNWECQKKYRRLRKSVVEHYRADSNPLKLKAATFLLDNLKDRYAIEGERYEKYAGTIKKYCQNPDTLYARLLSIRDGHYKEKTVKDIDVLTPEYLIENIDQAFTSWGKAGWKDQVSFDDFCEYILPYRFGNEPLENWRSNTAQDTLFKIIKDTLATFTDLQEATTYLSIEQSKIKKDFKLKWGKNSTRIPDLPYSALTILTTGTCANLTRFSLFGCSALAIPVANDFTPNWGNNTSGHDWAALITKSGSIPFILPVRDKLGKYKEEVCIPSKVYRHTFSENRESHLKQRGYCRFLPDFFNDPRLIDVTDLYMPAHDIRIPASDMRKDTFAYVAVYGRYWTPVGWGKMNNRTACFPKVGENVIYLPVSMSDSRIRPFNFPFRVMGNGEPRYLKPDTKNLRTVELTRKYALKKRIQLYINRMVHGKFQVADNKDFENAVTLYEIPGPPGVYYNEVPINIAGKYRYIRYLGSKESRCNVAEIEFYEKNGNIPLTGEKIGTKGTCPIENAFDGDVLTYFDTTEADPWIGLDLGKPVEIGKIRFVSRNDKNHIVPGNLYELYYWDFGWKSLGQKTATNYTLVYEKVPSNCLFHLKCHTEGKEERIFTYENGEQVWW